MDHFEKIFNRVEVDTEYEREGTDNVKWDNRKEVFGTDDVLPFSIADMDIAVPKAVTKALEERIEHPIYGYNLDRPQYLLEAVANWCDERHNYRPDHEDIIPLPGVVAGIAFALMAYTKPGDKVIVQTPVYPPFLETIAHTGRTLVENPLINTDGYYEIDFADFERKAKDPSCTAFILCNPHNPVGRVYKKEELDIIFEICSQYNVLVIADEIHSDIVYKGYEHTMFHSLNETAALKSIMFISVSKTFNLAGVSTAFAIIKDDELRDLFMAQLQKIHLTRANVFGVVATHAAYTECDKWVDDLLVFLEENVDYVVDYMHEHMPNIKVRKPEGTYLLWLDFRHYFTRNEELEEFLVKKARLGLNLGLPYGAPGEGFARINIGTRQELLKEAMQRLEEAIKELEEK